MTNMILEFCEVVDIFENYNVWIGDRETLWYRKAWMALEKEGLTTYKNLLDKSLVLIRVFTLIALYMEFCELAFEEKCYYEFQDWEETTELTGFRVGQLASKLLEDEDFANHDDYDALQDALIELVDCQRDKVVDCLIKNIGKGGESTIFVCMYLTCCSVTDEDEEFMEELTAEEKYEKDIEDNYDGIVNYPSPSKMRAFEWLSQGTYKLG